MAHAHKNMSSSELLSTLAWPKPLGDCSDSHTTSAVGWQFDPSSKQCTLKSTESGYTPRYCKLLYRGVAGENG